MTTLNLQVGADTDDANEAIVVNPGLMLLTGQTRVVMGSAGYYGHAGYRFEGVSGLSGSTITDAVLQFYANTTDSGSIIGTLYAHDTAAPGTFTSTAYNISDTVQRPRTTASVAAGGTQFGNWTAGGWYNYDKLSAINIVSIIQELSGADPSVIVLLWIHTSGSGERLAESHDDDDTLAAKLDIDLEAAGGVEVTPTVHNFAWAIPTPTLTYTPTALVYGWSIPTPVVVAGVLIEPSALAYGWSIPTPTWSGITTYTPTAHNYAWAIPTPSVVAGVSVTPTVLAYGWTIPTPTFEPGIVTLTPTVHNYAWSIPTPSVSIGEVIYSIWYEITRQVNVASFPVEAQYYLEVVMRTSAAAAPAYARLWNITDGAEVPDSEISTDSTDPLRVRSSAVTLSGSKLYRVEYGGESGSVITMHSGDIVEKTV